MAGRINEITSQNEIEDDKFIAQMPNGPYIEITPNFTHNFNTSITQSVQTQTSPQNTPQPSPQATTQVIPQATTQVIPQATPQISPQQPHNFTHTKTSFTDEDLEEMKLQVNTRLRTGMIFRIADVKRKEGIL